MSEFGTLSPERAKKVHDYLIMLDGFVEKSSTERRRRSMAKVCLKALIALEALDEEELIEIIDGGTLEQIK